MTNNSNNDKTEMIRFVMASVELNSSTKENAIEYLSSQGMNADSIAIEGLKRIKKMQLKIEAEKTKIEMISAESVKQKALDWVNSLLSNIDFSLPILVKQEELSMSFRNIESLSKEDIKNILVKHFTLKFLEERKKNNEL